MRRTGVYTMSLTDRAAMWMAEMRGDLEAELDDVQFRRTGEDREKPSAHLSMAMNGRFAEAIIWDSGEIELSYGTLDNPRDEHYEVDDPADLDALLTVLVERLRP